jgi:DNA-binding LacI/PurR family transcriptional regulator
MRVYCYRMATIYDVARVAGVSPATVSFVLNGGPRPVSVATKARVLSAIESLQFKPSAAARNLAKGSLNQIGLCFPAIGSDILSNYYSATLIDGALDAAASHSFDVILLTQRPSFSETFHRGRMDGAIVITPPDDLDLNALSANFPLVTIAALPPDAATDSYINFDVDNASGIMQAVVHLVQRGHRNIGHITGSGGQYATEQRLATFQQAMQLHGLIPTSVALGSFSRYYRQINIDSAHALLTQPTRPTALICANDAIARDAQEAAESLGLSVPKDLSLIGFDDSPPCLIFSPLLTTLRQPLRQIGHDAVVRLLRWITNQEGGAENHVLPPELIIRETSISPK